MQSPQHPAAHAGAALAGLAAVALILAVALLDQESAAASTTSPTAAAASQTVRDFLANAVLADNAYAARQYLTVTEQDDVARDEGGDQTCRDALTASPPSLDGIQSEGALHALDVRAFVLGDSTADVTVDRAATRRPRSFCGALQGRTRWRSPRRRERGGSPQASLALRWT